MCNEREPSFFKDKEQLDNMIKQHVVEQGRVIISQAYYEDIHNHIKQLQQQVTHYQKMLAEQHSIQAPTLTLNVPDDVNMEQLLKTLKSDMHEQERE